MLPVQELFTGALGRAYTYLYTPVLPKKDEMEMWLGYKLDGSIPNLQQESGIADELDEDVLPPEPPADVMPQLPNDREVNKDGVQSRKGREKCRLFRKRR